MLCPLRLFPLVPLFLHKPLAMEDAHALELKLESGKEKSNAFFAVYDGHGGKLAFVSQLRNLNARDKGVPSPDLLEKMYTSACCGRTITMKNDGPVP